MPRTFAPVRASMSLQAKFHKRLDAEIEAMHRSTLRYLISAYRANTPVMAQDRLPAQVLGDRFSGFARRWQKRFNDLGSKLAEYFVKTSAKRTDTELKRSLRDGGLTIRFRQTPLIRNAYAAVVQEQVGLIRSIASEHLAEVQGLVMRSVQRGGDAGELAAQLEQRYKVTKHRAALIARDQVQKVNSVFGKVRTLEALGPEAESIWCHSGVGHHPRPGHVKAGRDKLRYRVAEGAFIDGEYIQPGEKINCQCYARPVIPGF